MYTWKTTEAKWSVIKAHGHVFIEHRGKDWKINETIKTKGRIKWANQQQSFSVNLLSISVWWKNTRCQGGWWRCSGWDNLRIFKLSSAMDFLQIRLIYLKLTSATRGLSNLCKRWLKLNIAGILTTDIYRIVGDSWNCNKKLSDQMTGLIGPP